MPFLIVSNMRSGSTWLQMMLGRLCDVVTDFEMKWRPPYELQELHVPIRGKDFIFSDFFERLGHQPVKGSKLTFDFFPPEKLEELTECLPADLSIIHLTRDYFNTLNSFYRGIFHDYDESPVIAEKSPASHRALKNSKARYMKTNENTLRSRTRKVDPKEAANFLDIFLSVDQWAADLSSQRPYRRIDYSGLNQRFADLVRFVGSRDSERNIAAIIQSPPTKQLPVEIVIENEPEIRELAKIYEERKRNAFESAQSRVRT